MLNRKTSLGLRKSTQTRCAVSRQKVRESFLLQSKINKMKLCLDLDSFISNILIAGLVLCERYYAAQDIILADSLNYIHGTVYALGSTW